jgi:quinol monooxygenase YgiN/mannose-6-phosphate isomerase-like protein (cupin superfamily)
MSRGIVAIMSQVARNARTTAQPGRGEELAELLLGAAQDLTTEPGCELYLVSRQADDPDVVWVTELWRSQADLDACIERISGSDAVSDVMALVASSEMIELELLGGKAPATAVPTAPARTPYTIRRLTDAEDAAAKHGMGAMGEARFPNEELGTQQTGLSHHRIRAGARQPFGHRHEDAEEVYVVLSGSGLVKLDDDIAEIAALDAIRVAPTVARAFEGGTDGLELLAFGPLRPGDGELLPAWWA